MKPKKKPKNRWGGRGGSTIEEITRKDYIRDWTDRTQAEEAEQLKKDLEADGKLETLGDNLLLLQYISRGYLLDHDTVK